MNIKLQNRKAKLILILNFLSFHIHMISFHLSCCLYGVFSVDFYILKETCCWLLCSDGFYGAKNNSQLLKSLTSSCTNNMLCDYVFLKTQFPPILQETSIIVQFILWSSHYKSMLRRFVTYIYVCVPSVQHTQNEHAPQW